MPPTQDRFDYTIDHYYAAREPRSDRVLRIIATIATGATVYGTVLLGGDVTKGIQEGKEAVQYSHSQVHDIAPMSSELNPMYKQHGTFVLTGLGTKNPSATAEQLRVHREVGEVFGIEYSNQDLNIKEMANQVIEKARAARLQAISLDGYSAGGLIGLAIEAYIHEHAPDLFVASVVLNSTPVGPDGLSEQSARGIALMNHILSLSEDFKYYLHGRIAVEVLNRSERYMRRIDDSAGSHFEIDGVNSFSYGGSTYRIDYGALRREIMDVSHKMEQQDTASSSLIDSQAHFIVEANYAHYIASLDPMTYVVYTGSQNPSQDSVVNIPASVACITRSLDAHHQRYDIFLGNVGHANPTERMPEYIKLHEKIHARLTQGLSLLYLKHLMEDQDAAGHSVNALGIRPPR